MIGDQAAPGLAGPTRAAAIEALLSTAIHAGHLPAGLVLTEDPIARLCDTSRTPVRQALAALYGKGLLRRFDGRGYLVAGADRAEPLRRRLTRTMLGLAEHGMETAVEGSADRIADDFEATLLRALPFGQYRILEQAAADHYGVSRTVVRELLTRLHDRGVVGKDPRLNWIVGPLTARDVRDHYQIRARLEPLALLDGAPAVPPADIMAMRSRLDAAADSPDRLDLDGWVALEADIHERLLLRHRNQPLLRVIRQSQIVFAVNRLFFETIGPRPFHAALDEHRLVLELLLRGAYEPAAETLDAHLGFAATRTLQRLKAVSVFPEPPLPPYLHKPKRMASEIPIRPVRLAAEPDRGRN